MTGNATITQCPTSGLVVRVDSSAMTVSSPLLGFPVLPRLGVRGLGEALDDVEALVPLRRKLGHSPSGLVEAVRLDLVENFPAVLAPADQPGPFEHDQVLGDGLAGERDPSRQPARAYRTVYYLRGYQITIISTPSV